MKEGDEETGAPQGGSPPLVDSPKCTRSEVRRKDRTLLIQLGGGEETEGTGLLSMTSMVPTQLALNDSIIDRR